MTEQLKEKKKKLTADEITNALCLIAAVILLIVAFLPKKTIAVSGMSMDPTLYDGEKVCVEQVSEAIDLSRYDIVVGRLPGLFPNVIKRVVGTPGDTVEVIPPATLKINGEDQPEYWLFAHGSFTEPLLVHLGEGEFFLIGDNLENSCDSREKGPSKKLLYKVKGVAKENE